jgi:anti-sigma regulatory factor (Ser/Thr protein kinase)
VSGASDPAPDPPAAHPEARAFTIPNDSASLSAARAAARRHLARHAVDEAAVHAVELIVEELVGNVIRYGYDGQRDEIGIEIDVHPEHLLVTLTDHARPFDPTRHQPPAPAPSLAETPIGGRGIAMTRAVTGAMRYERRRGLNRLEVEVPRATAR